MERPRTHLYKKGLPIIEKGPFFWRRYSAKKSKKNTLKLQNLLVCWDFTSDLNKFDLRTISLVVTTTKQEETIQAEEGRRMNFKRIYQKERRYTSGKYRWRILVGFATLDEMFSTPCCPIFLFCQTYCDCCFLYVRLMDLFLHIHLTLIQVEI